MEVKGACCISLESKKYYLEYLILDDRELSRTNGHLDTWPKGQNGYKLRKLSEDKELKRLAKMYLVNNPQCDPRNKVANEIWARLAQYVESLGYRLSLKAVQL